MNAGAKELLQNPPRGSVLQRCQDCITIWEMKNLTVRLPDDLVSNIEAESQERNISKSDIVRERLEAARGTGSRVAGYSKIEDLVGSVDGLPADLSGRAKAYLRSSGYGKKRPR